MPRPDRRRRTFQQQLACADHAAEYGMLSRGCLRCDGGLNQDVVFVARMRVHVHFERYSSRTAARSSRCQSSAASGDAFDIVSS
jgi:hypothetical protein